MSRPTHRLFLALWPDEAVRARLHQQLACWRWDDAARLYAPQDWHVTLHFLVPVEDHRLAELRAGLGFGYAPFDWVLDRPALWPHGLAVLGCDLAPPPLLELRRRLGRGAPALAAAARHAPLPPACHVGASRPARRGATAGFPRALDGARPCAGALDRRSALALRNPAAVSGRVLSGNRSHVTALHSGQMSPIPLLAMSPPLPPVPNRPTAARRRVLLGPAVVVMLLALGACAGPAAAPPALPVLDVPAQWSPSSADASFSAQGVQRELTDPAALAQWWQGLGDPALSALVLQALQANTSARSAQAALQQARALRDVARAGTRPSLSASGSAQRSRAGDAAVGNVFRAGLDASWEADLFGRLDSAVAATEADLQAARYSLAQVRVSLAAEVALSYIDLRGLQARLAIARSNLAAQEETLQITDWRVQAGLASSLDLEQARTAAEQTRSQIPALQASLAQSAHALALLIGQPPQATAGLMATVQPVPQAPPGLALAFPAETLRQRPDLGVAEQRVLAALARVQQADAARRPSLRLSGSLGLAASRASDLFDPTALTRALLASVTASLFDGGAAQAQLRAQQAGLEQARIAYEATVLAALQEVEDALAALRGDRERLLHLRAAAEAAANADLLARQRYASGLIDFRTVLDTQRTLLSAQSELETTRATLSADHVRLYKALGGGWTPESVPTP